MLDLLYEPDERLRQIATPVAHVDSFICQLLDEMLHFMHEKNGIGLAAPQVNIFKRLIVLDVPNEDTGPLQLINPEIIWSSSDQASFKEGCLSIPDYYALVARPKEVKVSFSTPTQERQERVFTGLTSICIQHEIDHLNGILFIDHLSELKKNLFRRQRKNV